MSMPLDDLTGRTFGTLRVLGRARTKEATNSTSYEVCCNICGDEKTMQRGSLFRISLSGCHICNYREQRKKEWIGKTIDRGTIQALVGSDKHNKLKWEVRCHCGVAFQKITQYLVVAIRDNRLACNNCVRQMENEVYFWSNRIAAFRGNARKRGINWKLKNEDVRELMEQPCTYCGASPKKRMQGRPAKDGKPVPGYANSIDRVDSSRGYTRKNCVPACDLCNRMKSDDSIGTFLSRCERIYLQHRGKL